MNNLTIKAIRQLNKKLKFIVVDNKIIRQNNEQIPTQTEIEAKIKELEVEEVKKQIEVKATNYIKKQLGELDYDNEGEVALYANNPNSSWHDEAKALQNWIEEVYKKMYELQETVTIDNYKDINLDEIEANYPAFKE